jgi:hypothetical protein
VQPVALRERRAKKTILVGFAAPQRNIWPRKNRRTELVVGTTFFFVTLAALVAVKSAARIAVNSGRFGDLPQSTQVD